MLRNVLVLGPEFLGTSLFLGPEKRRADGSYLSRKGYALESSAPNM
jgi:hypothetical protein